MTTTRDLMAGILYILSLSEMLPVYLADWLYLSVVVTSNKYCIFDRVQGAVEN